MRLLKPETTEFTYRVISLAPDRYSLAVAFMVPFYLHDEGKPGPKVTSPVWEAIKPAVEGYSVFDEGWPKLRGEYVVFGAAYPASVGKTQPVSAQVTVGSLSKRLAVFGDRFFNALGGISDPLPFERMPIAPATALGGEGFDGNPYGKGAVAIKEKDGSLRQPLPNVELPDALMTSATSRPGVAGFWQYYPDMPQRAQYLGKFDDQWTKTRWPHLPLDTDFTYFQVAPPDQRLAEGFWQGGETVVLQNMHPKHSVLQAQLPALRVRVFPVVAVSETDVELAEVQTRLETVYLMPDQLTGVALYRTVIQVSTPDAREVVGLCAATEPLSEPARAAIDYVNMYKPVIRSALGPVVRRPPPKPSTELEESQRLDELMQQFTQERQTFSARMKAAGMSDAQVLQSLRQNPQTRAFALAIEQSSGSVEKFFEEVQAVVAMLDDESLKDELNPSDPSKGQDAQRGRLEVIRRKSHGQNCRDLSLADADLSGLDLSDMDFSGSMLSGACFVGATLRNAKFDRSVLVAAMFTGADLGAASFTLASLNKANFDAATLNGINAFRADLSSCSFTDAVLEGADLSMATLASSSLRNANLSAATAMQTDFTGAVMTRTNLAGAKLVEAVFSGADLSEADLSKATCIKANFQVAKLHKARLTGADLTDSAASEGTTATYADFRDANMDRASWQGVNLSGANLDRITGDALDLTGCGMSQTSMRRAVAKGVRFDRATIDQSNLSMSNFMEGSFSGARLTSVAMQSANLYGVNFLDVEFDNVNLDGSYIERTILAERLGQTQL
ncbi:DUF2169 family type VI secretion system accessory protein [Orrella daihaiensis]|uniref:DUF2169 domain-containing protein n=1 Tax=Orrella daihaiensis TaxID=2782176 RepID=A0ABY4AIE9_9BURK|nr:DUF2169 domain-containing protein [Orrella daihaiensis]UOD50070.1 DUF2169 domain-containing protein [Orrella daihaiensis]